MKLSEEAHWCLPVQRRLGEREGFCRKMASEENHSAESWEAGGAGVERDVELCTRNHRSSSQW